MGGRRWTKEELQKLEYMSDRYTVAVIAKKLGRSFDAVNIKINRMKIYGFRANTEILTFNQVSQILGVEWRTIRYTWGKMGLKTGRRGSFRVVSQEDLLRFLKLHPEAWSAARVTDDAIFHGQKWYEEKRKSDQVPKYKWTAEEVSKLKIRYSQGVPMRKIGEELGRSERAVICKIHSMHQQGFKI